MLSTDCRLLSSVDIRQQPASNALVDIREEAALGEQLDLLQGTLDLLILKTLALGPQHGWGIAQRIQQVSREVLQVGQGSLYPALTRLEQRGWIGSEWSVSDNNRRAKFYSLTASGARQLKKELGEWERLSADIAQSSREVKYFFNNQGQLELPIILKGSMPNVKPKPDGNYLAQMAQRNFLRKGMGDLKNPLGDKEAGGMKEEAPEKTKKSRRKSTEDMIRKGLEGLFGRESR